MMWKTLIFLGVIGVVFAGNISKHHTSYEFQIKHNYDYLKHQHTHDTHKHDESELVESEPEQKPQDEIETTEVQEHNEKKEDEKQLEEVKEEPLEISEDNVANAESEGPDSGEKKEHAGYEFLYKVIDPHTHDKKGQHEQKYHNEIKGVYWLLQPDGYKRTVDYHTDKHNGFHAKVDYSKPEEQEDEHEHSKAKSEYYIKKYYGHEKHIPVREEVDEGPEQDKQEESAEHIPIYVI